MYFIKYCPKKKEDMFFHEDIYDKLTKIKLSNNLLLYGKDGSGKSTMCNLLLENMFGKSIYNLEKKKYNLDTRTSLSYFCSKYHFEFDVLNYINKEKVFVSELIKNISSTHNIMTKSKKILVIKHADKLIRLSQHMLRRMIEKSNAIFIITVNNMSSIIDPLKSRFLMCRIGYPSVEKVTNLLKHVSKEENIKLSKRSLNIILSKTNNIKKILSLLEICYITGKFKNYDFNNVKNCDKLIKMLKNINISNYVKFKKLIYDMYVDGANFIECIKEIVKKVLPLIKDDKNKYKLIKLACECDMNIKKGNKPPIHFEMFLFQISELL